MILIRASDFEYVTGLDKIRLGVDVMPNRTDHQKNILYGKDVAVMMEHFGQFLALIDGFNIRGAKTLLHQVPELPLSFSRKIDGSVVLYRPSNVHGAKNLKACTGFPSIQDFTFTDDPIVTRPSYDDDFIGSRCILEAGWNVRMMNNIRKNRFAYLDLNPIDWWSDSDPDFNDRLVPYDEHGYFHTDIGIYAYSALAKETYTENDYDGWTILDESRRGMTFTYPTTHIVKAQLWMYTTGFHVSRSVDGISEDYDIPGFAFKMDESTNGSLSIDQHNVINRIRYAITSLGHTFYTINNVRPSGSNWGSFNFSVPLHALFVFQLDDHTKWWNG